MQAQSLPYQQAWVWCRGGCRLFAAHPIAWMSSAALYVCLVAIMARIPLPIVPGALIFLAGPIFTVSFMRIAQRLCNGYPAPLNGALLGFSHNLKALVIIGLIECLIFFLLGVLWHVIDPITPKLLTSPALPPGKLESSVAFGPLLAVLFIWSFIKCCLAYAPGLAAFYTLPSLKSIVFSIIGVYRNWPAWVLYAILLGCFALMPQFALGILVAFFPALAKFTIYILLIYWLCIFLPIFYGSLYVSFRAVYTADDQFEKTEATKNAPML